ncbi:MAG: ABC transporter ATP-binding protein, partial [Alkaliphilus sp.]
MENYKKYFNFYWTTIKPYIWLQLVVFFIWILHTSLSLISPYLTKILIDYVLGEKNITYLYIFIAVSISVFLIRLITSFLQGVVSTKLSYKLLFDLQYKLFNHIQKKEMSFFAKIKPGEIISRISSETGDILNLFNTTLMSFTIQIYTFIAVSVIMLTINASFTLIVFLSIPAIILTFTFFNKIFRRQNKEIMDARGELINTLQENINAIHTTKTHNAYEYTSARFKKSIDKYVKKQFKLLYTTLYNSSILMTIKTIPSLLLLYIGGKAVINDTMSLGDLIALSSYVSMLFQPIDSLSSLNIQLQRTLVAFKRYFEIYKDALIPNKEDKNSKKTIKEIDTITVDNISFAYNEQEIIKDLSITAKKGDLVIITGENGSGKTTLLNILTGIYKPSKGKIDINSEEMSKIEIESYTGKVGIVNQNTFLYCDTVENNIKLAKENIPEDYLYTLAKKLSLYKFITEKEDRFDAEVVENGTNYSGGQKQRIGILRALIGSPDLILLDEPSSFLDEESMGKFVKYINSIRDDKIIFMITHDRS